METTRANFFNRKTIILLAAFASVYIFWGSTYLAIKYAIETLPPFLMAGGRFVLAGGILFLIARFFSKGYETPKFAHWKTSFVVGTLLLLGGNGGVVFAEKYISSSLAALLVATEPFWIILLSWLWLKKSRPTLKTVAGIFLGFFGVWLLIRGQMEAATATDSMQFFASLAIIGAAMSWAIGSLYGLRAPVPKSSVLTAGMQMFSGGLVLLFVSFITGEMFRFNIAEVSNVSWFGVIYLIIFGSLVGFTAYSWLLKNAQPAMVSTYAYVNPVIAVFLGWLIASESFTSQMLFGATIIVGSVALITSNKNDKPKEPEMNLDDNIPNSGMRNCRPVSASA